MRIAVFSTQTYDESFLTAAAEASAHELVFLEPRLTADTASLADGAQAVCVFVNDALGEPVLERLHDLGVDLVALRCAGFNNVDLRAAERLGITVARVPAYSPHAVAEHALGLLLALNRHLHKAYNRVREGNFALGGLMGFDLYGKTVGVVGAGKIGSLFARMMHAMGCRVLICDPSPSEDVEAIAQRVGLQTLCECSDVVSLHCPLTPDTHHLIDHQALAWMKPGVVLINTSRGPIIDTRAVIDALKRGHLGSLGLDVYEEEGDLFFSDLSSTVIQDDVFARLLTFPNVLITGHQGFFTVEAMRAIAETTLANIDSFATGKGILHAVTAQHLAD